MYSIRGIHSVLPPLLRAPWRAGERTNHARAIHFRKANTSWKHIISQLAAYRNSASSEAPGKLHSMLASIFQAIRSSGVTATQLHASEDFQWLVHTLPQLADVKNKSITFSPSLIVLIAGNCAKLGLSHVPLWLFLADKLKEHAKRANKGKLKVTVSQLGAINKCKSHAQEVEAAAKAFRSTTASSNTGLLPEFSHDKVAGYLPLDTINKYAALRQGDSFLSSATTVVNLYIPSPPAALNQIQEVSCLAPLVPQTSSGLPTILPAPPFSEISLFLAYAGNIRIPIFSRLAELCRSAFPHIALLDANHLSCLCFFLVRYGVCSSASSIYISSHNFENLSKNTRHSASSSYMSSPKGDSLQDKSRRKRFKEFASTPFSAAVAKNLHLNCLNFQADVLIDVLYHLTRVNSSCLISVLDKKHHLRSLLNKIKIKGEDAATEKLGRIAVTFVKILQFEARSLAVYLRFFWRIFKSRVEDEKEVFDNLKVNELARFQVLLDFLWSFAKVKLRNKIMLNQAVYLLKIFLKKKCLGMRGALVSQLCYSISELGIRDRVVWEFLADSVKSRMSFSPLDLSLLSYGFGTIGFDEDKEVYVSLSSKALSLKSSFNPRNILGLLDGLVLAGAYKHNSEVFLEFLELLISSNFSTSKETPVEMEHQLGRILNSLALEAPEIVSRPCASEAIICLVSKYQAKGMKMQNKLKRKYHEELEYFLDEHLPSHVGSSVLKSLKIPYVLDAELILSESRIFPKLAIEVSSDFHHCPLTHELLGVMRMKKRQLALLNYELIFINRRKWLKKSTVDNRMKHLHTSLLSYMELHPLNTVGDEESIKDVVSLKKFDFNGEIAICLAKEYDATKYSLPHIKTAHNCCALLSSNDVNPLLLNEKKQFALLGIGS